jgi:hypothetical protein
MTRELLATPSTGRFPVSALVMGLAAAPARSAGASTVEKYGDRPLQLFYPSVSGPVFIYEDFRNILPTNPCPGS